MLVYPRQVLTTWRVCDRKGGLVRPGPLVLRALALAAPQVLISAGWLALVPPSVHRVGPASWQCYSLHAASQVRLRSPSACLPSNPLTLGEG